MQQESDHRSPRLKRVILHLDMDAFFAAIEVRENPALRGKPVIVGHRGRRGVVSTCSYEARRFGVHSALPSVTAERLCPEAIWLPVRMKIYSVVSGRIREILQEVSPVVEPVSIDEAFIDLTGISKDFAAARRTGEFLKKEIFDQEKLTSSVGIAPNKFLAKVASDLDKPDGMVVLSRQDLSRKLWPLPIDRLWGVGRKTAGALRKAGWNTILDLLNAPRKDLQKVVGSGLADHLLSLARGKDDRPVENGREAKSISEERTYSEDLRDPDWIHREMLARAAGVARSLRDEGLRARTVHLKIRTGDFTTWTRSRTLVAPTNRLEEILAAAGDLYREKIRLEGKGIRLLGIGVSHLREERRGEQIPLFTDPARDLEERVARAEDAVRRRFGEDAVTRAALLGRSRGFPPGE